MTKTIWVDRDNGSVYTNKEQIKVAFENDVYLDFYNWLNNHCEADQIWDANAEERTAIEQEYRQYCDNYFADYIADNFEAIEIEA